MSTTANDNERLGRDAMVHALLDEELGTERAPTHVRRTDAATILAKFAAGRGDAAAMRVHAIEKALADDGPTAPRWLASKWPHLCAAAALLAVAATFAHSWMPQDKGPSQQVGQVPQHPDPQAQVPKGQDPKAEAPPRKLDFEQFAKLLHDVKTVHVEPTRVADHSLPFDVDISGTPTAFLSHSLEPFLEYLPKDVRKLDAIEAEWMNRVTLLLDDGSKLHGAIYPFPKRLITGEPTTGVRLHVRGLDCDVRLGKDTSAMLRNLLEAATLAACNDRGVVLAPLTLKSFPSASKSLRLFRLKDEQLSGLARFPNLRKLDCSGLRKTLGKAGLRAIAKSCPRLEELVLDGMRLPDEFVVAITDLTKLTKLSLHGVKEFTGEGLHYFTLSAKRRDGLTHLDLRYIPTLTDEGLRRIAECLPMEVLLQGSGKQITLSGLRRVASGTRLKVLGIEGWDLEAMPGDRKLLPGLLVRFQLIPTVRH